MSAERYLCGGFIQIVGSRARFDQSYNVKRFKMAAAVTSEEVALSEDISDGVTWALEKRFSCRSVVSEAMSLRHYLQRLQQQKQKNEDMRVEIR